MKGGEYEDFSIIAGDSKRALLQQLEMSYYCIAKPYYNLKFLALVLVLVLRTDLTIICVKVRLFLHVIISQLVCSCSHIDLQNYQPLLQASPLFYELRV